MTDTFKQLIEEDIKGFMGNLVSGAKDRITDKGKEYGNAFLAGLGSARASGRLDYGLVLTDLKKTWKYYITQQRLAPSPAAMVDFFQTVFGLEMSEDEVFRAVYGYVPGASSKPPSINAPHVAVIAPKIKSLMDKKASEQKIGEIATDLARIAEGNEADATYIIVMLKWIGSRAPQLLKRPGMNPLAPYMHGGRMDEKDVNKILGELAKQLLKRQIILQRMEDEKGDQPADKDGSDDETNPVSQKKAGSVNIDPPSTQQEPNWGGLKEPNPRKTLAHPDQVFKQMKKIGPAFNKVASLESMYKSLLNEDFAQSWVETLQSFNYKVTNALAAQFMQIVVRYNYKDFISVIGQVQQRNGQRWPRTNMEAAFKFVRFGGDVDEMTAEFNHFLNTPEHAATNFVELLRFVAKEWNQKNGGDQSSPAPQGGE